MINLATCCILKNQDHILLVHRMKPGNIHYRFYIPPGGRVEPNETAFECVKREVQEETNLKIIEPKLRIISTFHNEGRVLGGQKDPKDWYVLYYETEKYSGKLKEENTFSPLYWIHESRLGKENITMYEGDIKLIKLLKKKGIFEVIINYSEEKLLNFRYSRVD